MTDAKKLFKNLYKDEGRKPLILTKGQSEIFGLVLSKKKPRVHCLTYTQYGKSLIIGLGVLTAVSTFPEKWAIVAPSNKKAKIIMGYIIDHVFDNEYTASKFEIGSGESRERIRRERSKDRLNFRHSDGTLGEVFIISSEGKRTKDVLDALMGFGSQNIIIDESSLIDDVQYAGILRMLGGYKENFLMEVGNAMRRNHFYRSSRDEHYYRIKIDYRQGIKENRITQEFVDEMKRNTNPQVFGMLYECNFPDPTAIDDRGYSSLITENDLDNAYSDDIQLAGNTQLLVDVAGGGNNYSTIIRKAKNGAEILYHKRLSDTMTLVGLVTRYATDPNYVTDGIHIDEIGVGKGPTDRLKEIDEIKDIVVGVNNGAKSEEEDFINIRAQSYWGAGDAIRSGFKLKRHRLWEELLVIKWKVQSDKKIKIMSKEEMLKDGIQSPDVADALALGWAKPIPKKTGVHIYKPQRSNPKATPSLIKDLQQSGVKIIKPNRINRRFGR
jgi:hypothetical protein|tara:strand:+ start:517 stop:2004 length:1488 start_codon:yes stop_codon:yes gene_type:complete